MLYKGHAIVFVDDWFLLLFHNCHLVTILQKIIRDAEQAYVKSHLNRSKMDFLK